MNTSLNEKAVSVVHIGTSNGVIVPVPLVLAGRFTLYSDIIAQLKRCLQNEQANANTPRGYSSRDCWRITRTFFYR